MKPDPRNCLGRCWHFEIDDDGRPVKICDKCGSVTVLFSHTFDYDEVCELIGMSGAHRTKGKQ